MAGAIEVFDAPKGRTERLRGFGRWYRKARILRACPEQSAEYNNFECIEASFQQAVLHLGRSQSMHERSWAGNFLPGRRVLNKYKYGTLPVSSFLSSLRSNNQPPPWGGPAWLRAGVPARVTSHGVTTTAFDPRLSAVSFDVRPCFDASLSHGWLKVPLPLVYPWRQHGTPEPLFYI